MKFEGFLRTWQSGSSEEAPRSESATETISDAEREAGVVNIAKDGRRVYCMNDRVAIALRANTPSDRLKPRYYWKRTD
jgi:alkylhydroperoxidase family enzyme